MLCGGEKRAPGNASAHRLTKNEEGLETTAAADEGGQLEVLNWLGRNRIAWSADTRRAAWRLGYELYVCEARMRNVDTKGGEV